MATKQVQVFEVEYDAKGMDWKAKIAAFNREDALGYLASMLKSPYKVKSFSTLSTVDAITTQVIDSILKQHVKVDKEDKEEKKPGRPKKTDTEKPKDSEAEKPKSMKKQI